MTEGTGFWFVCYVRHLGMRGDQHMDFGNAVIDEHPFDWLAKFKLETARNLDSNYGHSASRDYGCALVSYQPCTAADFRSQQGRL